MTDNLCERCHQKPWVAPVFLKEKPTEVWCEDCIDAENACVIGSYFETRQQKKVMGLLREAQDKIDNSRELCQAISILAGMWGEE